MDSGMPMPTVHGRRVLMPSAWQVLAHAVLADPGASEPARELARLVLEAAAREPRPRPPEWVPDTLGG